MANPLQPLKLKAGLLGLAWTGRNKLIDFTDQLGQLGYSFTGHPQGSVPQRFNVCCVVVVVVVVCLRREPEGLFAARMRGV
jgi:hypothetical protein